uniref:Uncharacterized protein n=1 Tax=Babesia bovis TaxID=5865 RepID=S6BHR6_BABBO|nr:hypothetical protein [Babesia bovis]
MSGRPNIETQLCSTLITGLKHTSLNIFDSGTNMYNIIYGENHENSPAHRQPHPASLESLHR